MRRGRRLWPALVGILALALALCAVALIGAYRRSSPATSTVALPPAGRWMRTSLHGDVTALLPLPGHPATVLAATTNGIWRSGDAGVTWQPDGSGTRGRSVFVLASSAGSTNVWAGNFDGTVSQRDAAGARVVWRRISPVLLSDPSYEALPIYSLAVSPLKGHPLLAGSMGAIFRGVVSGGAGMWRWQRVWAWSSGSAPPPGCFGRCSASGNDSNAGSGGGAVTSLLVAPWDVHLIFGSLFEASPPVVVSDDGGNTWAPAAEGLPASLPAQDLASGDVQARQIFLTTMGGGVWQRKADGSWQDIDAGLPQRHAMPLLATGGALYAGTMASGVYERVGSGAWHRLGSGLAGPAATVMGLAESAGPHGVLLAGTADGVYRYMPHG
jgi:hypothetical protein